MHKSVRHRLKSSSLSRCAACSTAYVDDLRSLRLLVLLPTHPSLRATAKAAHISPSSLCRRLAALERSVGLPLYERRSNGVDLTEAGRWFVTRAVEVLAEVDGLFQSAAAPFDTTASDSKGSSGRLGSTTTGCSGNVPG